MVFLALKILINRLKPIAVSAVETVIIKSVNICPFEFSNNFADAKKINAQPTIINSKHNIIIKKFFCITVIPNKPIKKKKKDIISMVSIFSKFWP